MTQKVYPVSKLEFGKADEVDLLDEEIVDIIRTALGLKPFSEMEQPISQGGTDEIHTD